MALYTDDSRSRSTINMGREIYLRPPLKAAEHQDSQAEYPASYSCRRS